MEKLSIIVPVYNVEKYLEECIESLIKQSYENLEIILVNDGSTDSSGQICDKFSLRDKRIKVIHQKNQGLPFARNAGLEIAEGEYIGFIDSDDLVDTDMYRKLIRALEENQADMAVCNFYVFNKKGVRAVSTKYNDEVVLYSNAKEVQFYNCALDSSWNKVYRHKIIREFSLRFEDKKIVAQEDFWFLMRYCSHISKIVTISSADYGYRDRKSSITKSGIDKDITERCILFIELTNKYLDKLERKSDFLTGRVIYEMLFASINQTYNATPRKIYKIIKKFSAIACYKTLFNYREESIQGVKKFYNALKIAMLKWKFYLLFSYLESLRVVRLHNKICVDDYYR